MGLYSAFKSLFSTNRAAASRNRDDFLPGSSDSGMVLPHIFGGPKLTPNRSHQKKHRSLNSKARAKISRSKPLIGSVRHRVKKARAFQRRIRRAAGMA